MQTVEVEVEAPQAALHEMICSLYAKVLTMDAAGFEDMIAIANYLQVSAETFRFFALLFELL